MRCKVWKLEEFAADFVARIRTPFVATGGMSPLPAHTALQSLRCLLSGTRRTSIFLLNCFLSLMQSWRRGERNYD